MVRTTPPIIIQTALSVGDPVKKRETSELNEFVAFTPKIKRMIPAARQARAMGLFIFFREFRLISILGVPPAPPSR